MTPGPIGSAAWTLNMPPPHQQARLIINGNALRDHLVMDRTFVPKKIFQKVPKREDPTTLQEKEVEEPKTSQDVFFKKNPCRAL